MTATMCALAVACDRGGGNAPPLGEAIVVVDTDLPVPKLAGRLRVDTFTPEGTWYATRDLLALRASVDSRESDWPLSFAVALAPDEGAKDVVLRLRAYPEGKVRDYLGERFRDRPVACEKTACAGNAPPDCCPLVEPPPTVPQPGPTLADPAGAATPTTEPDPPMTVDRLVLVHLTPGVVGRALVVLHGACAGAMADIRDFTRLSTCVDTENVRVPPAPAVLDEDLGVPATLAGTFEQPYAAACTTTPRPGTTSGGVSLHDEEACIPGGGFVLGGRETADGSGIESVPERTTFVTSFLMDRFEVTVGRYRNALAGGYKPPEKLQTDSMYCTWSAAPGAAEEEPLNCITWEDAHAFCQYEGGDLPTEAQWEYAATQAGRAFKVHYPWGDGNGEPPSCASVIYGRVAQEPCADDPTGPVGVGVVAAAGFDVTPSDGGAVVDLGGNVAELVLDSFAPYAANCWLAASLADPSCTTQTTDQRGNRGGYYTAPLFGLFSATRNVTPTGAYASELGFRCVRPGAAR